MVEVAEDMENHGGKWRNRWRKEPQKCRRVLAAFREGSRNRIIPAPGGYMNDLWLKRIV